MAQLVPVPVRLSPAQLAWLDTHRKGPIVTRSEAIRHLIAAAMKRDARRQQQRAQAHDAA